MNVVTLCGSLSAASANADLLDAFETNLRAQGASVHRFEGLGTIPPLNPDATDPSVDDLRAAVQACDVFVVAAPEYAGGLAGVAKNALDWLVQSGSADQKIAVAASAGTCGGEFARAQLVRTLSWQGARVIASLGVAVPKTRRDPDGGWDAGVRASVEEVCASVRVAFESPTELRRLCTAMLTEHGIDPGRFGWTHSDPSATIRG